MSLTIPKILYIFLTIINLYDYILGNLNICGFFLKKRTNYIHTDTKPYYNGITTTETHVYQYLNISHLKI